MTPYSYPKNVMVLDNYRLLIEFENDERRIFDVKPYLDDQFFAPLKNPGVFNTARVGPITIEWAFDIDICPEELYFKSIPA